MTVVEHTHIAYREDGKPIIAGTTMKVIELVLAHLAWGWDADMLHRSFPHLSLAQIHAAMAYYYDNRDLMDAAIEAQEREDDIFAHLGTSPAQRRLAHLRATRQ